MANHRAPDVGGRVKVANGSFVEGLINRRWPALGGLLLHI